MYPGIADRTPNFLASPLAVVIIEVEATAKGFGGSHKSLSGSSRASTEKKKASLLFLFVFFSF